MAIHSGRGRHCYVLTSTHSTRCDEPLTTDVRSSCYDDVVSVHDIAGQTAHKISLQLRCQFEAPLTSYRGQVEISVGANGLAGLG